MADEARRKRIIARLEELVDSGDRSANWFALLTWAERAENVDELIATMRTVPDTELQEIAGLGPNEMRSVAGLEDAASRFQESVAEREQTQAETEAVASIEESTGVEFLVDEAGEYVRDRLGGFVLADGVTAVYLGANGEIVGQGPAYLDDEEEGPQAIGGFDDQYYEGLQEVGVYDEQLLDRVRAIDKPASQTYQDMLNAEAKPSYFAWDQWRNFATKSPEYQTQVQQALVAAGLMNEKDFISGTWTYEAARAMEQAMAEANASGGRYTWDQVLRRRATAIERGEEEDTGGSGPLAGRVLQLESFREPDYATLSQNVKALFRNQLGRDPVDWEVALLADQLNTDYRAAYDADVQAATAAFEAGNHAILTGEDSDDPQIAQPGAVPSVDPVARLRERFESDYANSRDLALDRMENRQDVSNVFSILTQTTNALQGSLR